MDIEQTICVKSKIFNEIKIINKFYRYQIFDKYYRLTTITFDGNTFNDFDLNDSITQSGNILINDKDYFMKSFEALTDENLISEDSFNTSVKTFFENISR